MGPQPPVIFEIWPLMMIGIVVFFIIVGFVNSAASADAKTAYEASLSRLAKNPANPDLRKQTIELAALTATPPVTAKALPTLMRRP